LRQVERLTRWPLRALALVLVIGAANTSLAQDASAIRAGTCTYQLSLARPNGETTPLGTRTVTVSETALGGTPGWLVAESRTGTLVPTFDSAFVSRADLSPVRWIAGIGTAQLAASFTRDSVFGVVQNYQGRANFVLGIPPNLLLSAGLTERMIELLPRKEGFRASMTLLLVPGTVPTLVPADLTVEREETVTVLGRAVRAWRVALRAGAVEQRYWVSRDDGRVVRTEQALPEGMLVAELVVGG